jgi:ribonuclease P/MRP protein subunit RPP1
MKRFADLHLCVSFKDVEQQKKMITKASELGYALVGVPIPATASPHDVEGLRKRCGEAGLELVTRVDLAPRNPRELLEDLRRLRRRFEIVSVLCASKPVARQAAKDRRVDLLSFSAARTRDRFFDNAEAELASKALASFEIDLAPFLSLSGFLRTRLITSLRKELTVAKRFEAPLVISSGAPNEFLLRNPHDYAALTFLFDLDSSLALRALSETPLTIVERNREKLSPGFVMPGLRVVRRGKDP